VPDYRPEVLEELARFGVRPGPATPPGLIREYLSDLYRYEIRRLRSRLLRGEIPKADYANHVVGLRQRYPLLSILTKYWTF